MHGASLEGLAVLAESVESGVKEHWLGVEVRESWRDCSVMPSRVTAQLESGG